VYVCACVCVPAPKIPALLECCLLFAVCCLLFAVCCLLFVVCCVVLCQLYSSTGTATEEVPDAQTGTETGAFINCARPPVTFSNYEALRQRDLDVSPARHNIPCWLFGMAAWCSSAMFHFYQALVGMLGSLNTCVLTACHHRPGRESSASLTPI
jgi:hypothetical protein